MKKFLMLLSILCCGIAAAHTINWHVDGNIYQTTTCDSGESITPPTPPYKYGYHFKEWEKRFTHIEYIQSTGTQFIKTGFGVSGQSAEITFALKDFTDGCLCGSAIGSFCGSVIWYSLGRSDTNMNGLSSYSVVTITYDSNVISLYKNGVLTAQHSASAKGGELFIFADNVNGTAKNSALFKLYYFKIYNNNTLIRDFIPVLDKDGTPCMYDKVENKFYYNAGTGQFIAGPVLTE